MSILVPKFNMLWKRLLLFKLVSFGISQYFYKDANENFLVYDSGISLISSMAFTPFLYCWECQRVWVVKNSYPITLEIINQLIQNIHCTKNPISQVLEHHGKLKKTQVNIIFPSTFWLKKKIVFPTTEKVKIRTFL